MYGFFLFLWFFFWGKVVGRIAFRRMEVVCRRSVFLPSVGGTLRRVVSDVNRRWSGGHSSKRSLYEDGDIRSRGPVAAQLCCLDAQMRGR